MSVGFVPSTHPSVIYRRDRIGCLTGEGCTASLFDGALLATNQVGEVLVGNIVSCLGATGASCIGWQIEATPSNDGREETGD